MTLCPLFIQLMPSRPVNATSVTLSSTSKPRSASKKAPSTSATRPSTNGVAPGSPANTQSKTKSVNLKNIDSALAEKILNEIVDE